MSTIQTVKQIHHWVAATRRDDACQGCGHVNRRMVGHITTWWCSHLNITTSALAICDRLAIIPEESRHG